MRVKMEWMVQGQAEGVRLQKIIIIDAKKQRVQGLDRR